MSYKTFINLINADVDVKEGIKYHSKCFTRHGSTNLKKIETDCNCLVMENLLA